jgi:hypothetical protein
MQSNISYGICRVLFESLIIWHFNMAGNNGNIRSTGLQNSFVSKYQEIGEERFYEFLIEYSFKRLDNGDLKKPTPETELLLYHDKFLHFYRQDKTEVFISIARIFRRAAHQIYRHMIEHKLIEHNPKFLNLVS